MKGKGVNSTVKMLPSLANLRITDVTDATVPRGEDIDTRLDLLPDAVLSKVIKDTGNARSLCATADALKQTSRGFRDMGAWSDLAAEYSMPGQPAQNTVDGWRQHVLLWCDKIRTGRPDGFDLTYVQSALDAEMWAGTAQGYAWILSNGGTVPLAWLRGQARQNVLHVKNERILDMQLARFTDGRTDKFRLLDQLITAALTGSANGPIAVTVAIVKNLFMRRLIRAHWALTPGSQLALLSGQAAMDAHINQVVTGIVRDFYEKLLNNYQLPQQTQFLQMLIPEVEQVAPPDHDSIKLFINWALYRRMFPLAQWFYARHPMSRIELVELRDEFNILNEDELTMQGRAVIDGWIAAL